MSSQTEEYYLKDRNSAAVDNFDLYDHVKKSCQYTSYSDQASATSKVNERLEKHKEKEEEESRKINVAMAPMTGLMPGHQRTSREESAATQAGEYYAGVRGKISVLSRKF